MKCEMTAGDINKKIEEGKTYAYTNIQSCLQCLTSKVNSNEYKMSINRTFTTQKG